jgi:hypothetical protein
VNTCAVHRLVVWSGGPPLQGQPIAAFVAAAGGVRGPERFGQAGWYRGSDALSSLKGRERLCCPHSNTWALSDLGSFVGMKAIANEDAEVKCSNSWIHWNKTL